MLYSVFTNWQKTNPEQFNIHIPEQAEINYTGVRFPKASLANYDRKFRRYQHSSTIRCFSKT